jgi:hypothetical protein
LALNAQFVVAILKTVRKTPPLYHAQIALYKNVAVGGSSLEEDKLFLKILYIIPGRL